MNLTPELKCPHCGASAEEHVKCIVTVDEISPFTGKRDTEGQLVFSAPLFDLDSSRNYRLFCEACLTEWPANTDELEWE